MMSMFKHAEECYPNESCGLLLSDTYLPCDNIHPDSLNNFEIHEEVYFKHIKQVTAIIHSHNNSRHASEMDMAGQLRTNVPWGIINVKNGISLELNWLGGPTQNLYGRKFINGIADCFSFCRDFYKTNHNITLPSYPHSIDFWKHDHDIIMANFEEAGFEKVRIMQPGDILIFKFGESRVANHTAVYLGAGLIGHHLIDKQSRKEPLKPFESNLVCAVRHKSGKTNA